MTAPDAVALAAAWRRRIAAGYSGPVTVELTPRGWTVYRVSPTLGRTRLADYPAKYRAHAHAETIARRYDPPQETTTP